MKKIIIITLFIALQPLVGYSQEVYMTSGHLKVSFSEDTIRQMKVFIDNKTKVTFQGEGNVITCNDYGSCNVLRAQAFWNMGSSVKIGVSLRLESWVVNGLLNTIENDDDGFTATDSGRWKLDFDCGRSIVNGFTRKLCTTKVPVGLEQ